MSTANQPVVVQRDLNASIDQVWEALTSNGQMKSWFFKLKDFQAKKGFKFEFTAQHKGFKYVHLCQVKEVIPKRKLSYSWRYKGAQGNSLVTIELLIKGKQTRLILTHSGIETFPAIESYAKKNFIKGWTHIIGTGLKQHVEAVALEASKREIVITRLIHASPKRVWEAFSNSSQVCLWWGPKGFTSTIEKREFKVGGVWNHTMHGPDGTDYPNKSIFREIIKYKKIVYTNGNGKKGSKGISFTSTWTFEAQGKNTQITMRLVLASAKQRDYVVKEYGAIEGGKQTLGRLDQFVLSNK